MLLGDPNPTTSYSLLERLRNVEDRAARLQVIEIYTPFLFQQIQRKIGLQDSDAEDAVQEVLIKICTGIVERQYDPERRGFRRWMATVARNEALALLRKRGVVGRSVGDAGLSGVVEIDNMDEVFEREHQQYLLQTGLKQIRPEFKEQTWQAFYHVAIEGRPAAEVAAELGTTANAIYIARCKVLRRLKEHLADML